MIKGHDDIRIAYQDDCVAKDYVANRFVSPLGAMLHDRQVREVHKVVRQQAIRRALEVAPGPARLTVDVAPLLEEITLLDASPQMLDEARQRLSARGLDSRAKFVEGDAFNLSLSERFGLVYSFRLIRHFEREDRIKLYRQMLSVLSPGGWLVFDAVNGVVSARLRAANPGDYAHFDAMLRPDELREELREVGLELVRLVGVQYRYTVLMQCQRHLAFRLPAVARMAMEVVDRLGGEPLEWVVVCRRA